MLSLATVTAIRTRFVSANGLDFEVHECGQGDRLALCLHGFPESAYSWRHQLPLLAELGYRAWAPNLRGYGGSSRPAGVDAYRIEHLVGDVVTLIDAAGASRTVLLGHDWGGGIGWMTALTRACPLDGLVIMNAPHPLRFVEELFRWPQIWRSWYVFAFQIPWLPERLLARADARPIADAFLDLAVDRSRFPPEVLDVYRTQAILPGALTAMVNYYRASRHMLRTPRPFLARRIDTPTLVIWGEADTALGLELLDHIEPLVEDLTVHRLPGVSHWVQQEAPEQVNDLLAAWLRQLDATETRPT